MSARIQEMTIQDYEEVHTLWEESEGIELSDVDSKDAIARFLDHNPGLSFVARDNKQLVGVILCGHDGRRGYIDQLAVRKSHHRHGIGRALVQRCLYNLMRVGIRKLHLFVLEDNQDAISFWKKLGCAHRVELVMMCHHTTDEV